MKSIFSHSGILDNSNCISEKLLPLIRNSSAFKTG